jgi:hypothetical protein
MKEEVHKIAEYVLACPPNSSSDIKTYMSDPLNRNRSGKPKFWKQADWQAIRNRAKDAGADSPIINLFMEDEYGVPIPEGVKNTLRGDLASYWNELLKLGEEPTNFTNLGLSQKLRFRDTFEEMYPWLRLCEAHWKVDHLWINYFSTWRKSRTSPEPNPHVDPKPLTSVGPKPPRSEEPMAIVDTSSTLDFSSGSKRRREDPEDLDDAPKRFKGKGKEISTSAEFHSPPLPTKKVALKLVKVSQFAFYSAEHH